MTSKLVLGTVQFGLDYGINNAAGKPNNDEVFKVLETAYCNNIRLLDSAELYGDALEVIAAFHEAHPDKKFNVINKVKYSENLDVEALISKRLDSLKIPHFEVCYFHSFDDIALFPSLLEDLKKLKKQEKIKNIGVSLYTEEQFGAVLKMDEANYIQLPFNLLDNENIRGKYLKEAVKSGKVIHTRSVFLQGLFFKELNMLPEKLQPLKPYLEQLRELCQTNNVNMSALALQYAISQNEISGVLIGVDNVAQLVENIQFSNTSIEKEVLESIKNITVKEQELLNPVNWK